MQPEVIARFVEGPGKLRDALAGLGPDDCRQRVAPGTWSIQELVIHVVDSDAVGWDRMKRIIAEERPPLLLFDETRFVERLHPERQALEDAVLMLELGRRQMARVLGALEPAEFARVGIHSERGEVTLGEVVEGFTEHLEHHLEFLRAKRERVK